jgi:glutamine synthetase
MREFTALFWPTPNSYKRNVPYSWAASTVSWGVDNRSTGLRAIVEQPEATRIEHRVPGADSNPYIAIAACLAAGLHGVENEIEPPEPFQGDAYASADRFASLPTTLEEALVALEESSLARELLGRDFVEHYLIMKRFEAEKYRQQVSEWEVRRYAEMA